MSLQGPGAAPGSPRGLSHSVTYLASSARAMIPAASGAEAEVPVCLSVQWWCRSAVTWGDGGGLNTVACCWGAGQDCLELSLFVLFGV